MKVIGLIFCFGIYYAKGFVPLDGCPDARKVACRADSAVCETGEARGRFFCPLGNPKHTILCCPDKCNKISCSRSLKQMEEDKVHCPNHWNIDCDNECQPTDPSPCKEVGKTCCANRCGKFSCVEQVSFYTGGLYHRQQPQCYCPCPERVFITPPTPKPYTAPKTVKRKTDTSRKERKKKRKNEE